MTRVDRSIVLASPVIALALAAGCGSVRSDADRMNAGVQSAQAIPAGQQDEHGHRPGARGGGIVSIGRDEYHAEAVLEDDGVLRLYMLDQDETRVLEVERQDLTAYVKPGGDRRSVVIAMKADPMPEDSEGKTSRFTGALPRQLAEQDVQVTIPALRIAGQRFYVRFPVIAESAEPVMPSGVADAEARALYLTPGGLYTEADIEANGSVTAAEKYRGFRAKHDFNPAAGDPICPITRTKANPECTWIIGGKTYEFCCPPCIDEFLVLAKTEPDKVLPPDSYVKK